MTVVLKGQENLSNYPFLLGRSAARQPVAKAGLFGWGRARLVCAVGAGRWVCGVFCATLLFSFPVHSESISGRVVSIADGDTLTVLDAGNRQWRIRLAEIDAPEVGHGRGRPGQPFGVNSREALAGLCFRRAAVVTVLETDRYGRSVGRVVCDGQDVNLEQVRSGMAWAYRRYNRRSEILAAEGEARGARRGLWRDAGAVAPWDWRRGG